MQVAEGVHRLTGGVCSFYLVEDGGKLVLVDAGAPATGTWQALRSLDVLDGLPADVVLPGHGEPWTEGAAEAARLARLAGPATSAG